MPSLGIHLSISAAFLGVSLYIAWGRRAWKRLRIASLALGIFWLPGVSLGILAFEEAGKSWEWLIVSISWLAAVLVLGLCLMWSKRVHAHGRLMIILVLIGIAGLLGALGYHL
jgi:hypothetical protein